VFWPARSPAYPPQPGGRATQTSKTCQATAWPWSHVECPLAGRRFHFPTAAARPPDLPPRAAAVLLEWGGAQGLAARAPSHPETAHYIRAAVSSPTPDRLTGIFCLS